MNIREYTDEFHPDDLVTWHESYENKFIPVPGVVIRQEPDSIIIKARVQGVLKEVQVSPRELAIR
ncbi:MAG TPA: hypothetical protein VK553_05075 [Candidatus Nitrosopolaris rasttigaisensis]|nr:hypothetical protein [Candidatus Nitrosopolaris rasttigaisensis]